MRKVLIIDLTNKAGLAVARNLAKHNILVEAVYFRNMAAQYSRFISTKHFIGNPFQNVSNFSNNLVSLCSRNNYYCVIPISDAALEICRLILPELMEFSNILGINSIENYQFSIDKSKLLKQAEYFHLKIPNTIYINELNDLNSLDLNSLQYPVVAKPASSAVITNNVLVEYKVKVCNTGHELIDFVREIIASNKVLLQEYISGFGVGYNFLSIDGRVICSYVHKRLIEHSGVSTLRKSFPNNSFSDEDKIHQLIKSMAWNGVGMLEFKCDENNNYTIMEFNGRFYGSTELAVKSGYNFPFYFFRIFADNNTQLQIGHFNSVVVRFLHDELLQQSYLLLKFKIFSFIKYIGSLLFSVFKRNYYIEDSVFSDWKFVLMLYFIDIKRVVNNTLLRVKLKLIQVIPAASDNIPLNSNIVFICFGNICRSPFAEQYAKSINFNYSFYSAGIYNMIGRKVPLNGLLAAKEFNIDLDNHKSKFVHSQKFDTSTIFLVTDKYCYHYMKSNGFMYVFFISNNEIIDPYNKDFQTFLESYSKMKIALDKLFKNN